MQCDVDANVDDISGEIPYVREFQANLVSDLHTRVVIPMARLHPLFSIDDQDMVMATHLMAALRKQTLGNVVTSLGKERDNRLSAIDVIFGCLRLRRTRPVFPFIPIPHDPR